MPRSATTRHGPPGSRFHTETNWPYPGGSAGFVLLVIFDRPLDRPMSPGAATSVKTGRQSGTMGGAARERRLARAFVHPPRPDTPAPAKVARNAARLSS